MNQEVLDFCRTVISPEDILIDEPMSRHTTFRCGGPADVYIKVSDAGRLSKLVAYLNEEKAKYFVSGNGSNLLVSDEGYHGVIISTMGMNNISVDGNRIIADAGALNSRIAAVARDNGLSGMEALSGIPGTIGGGVCMNAGAYGSEMKDIVEMVDIIDSKGCIDHLIAEQMDFKYRSSKVRENGYLVTGVILRLYPSDKAQIDEDMAEYASRRREKQPLEYPSAGSTFKRPAGNYAGKLIEEAGLRGYSVGDACVSDKHCGFVINKGHATSTDVYHVIQHVQEKVKENSGTELETEVILLGDFS